MKKIDIKISRRSDTYPIFIGERILEKIDNLIELSLYSKFAIVSDEIIADKWLSYTHFGKYQPSLTLILPPGESSKNINSVTKIWNQLAENKFDRKSLVINIGGGVIGDMGGFAAATYMRGIDFVQVPTTLLSMVDASVGGKLGIDFGGYKNIIGSFNQPKAVIIDVDTLGTLPKREFISGFAEIIKHGLIDDLEYFRKVTEKNPHDFTKNELTEIICESVRIKARIVEADEKETGQRKILNFGHTIGHAIESLSLQTDTPLLHGEAIALGMIAEAKLSEIVGYIESSELKTLEDAVKNTGLPVRIKRVQKNDVFNKMRMDKKNEKGKIKWTLLKKIGEADFNIEIDNSFAEKAISYIFE